MNHAKSQDMNFFYLLLTSHLNTMSLDLQRNRTGARFNLLPLSIIVTSDKTPVLDAIDAWRGLAPCILIESFANCCLNIIRASHTVYLLEL